MNKDIWPQNTFTTVHDL